MSTFLEEINEERYDRKRFLIEKKFKLVNVDYFDRYCEAFASTLALTFKIQALSI